MTAAANSTNSQPPVPPVPPGSMPQVPSPAAPPGVWTALILLTAVIIGVGAGVLAWAGGANPPNAILVGGASFGGTALLILAVFNFHRGRSS